MAVLFNHYCFLLIVVMWITCASCQQLLFTVIEGQSCDDYSDDITTDRSGNIYVTGRACNATTGWTGAYVAKYSPDGQKLWKIPFGTHQYDEGFRVRSDKEDNVYVASRFGRSNENVGSIVLLKLDPNGSILFSLRFGTLGRDEPHGLAIDADNNVLIAGVFDAGAALQNFIRKYTPSGVLIFERIVSLSGLAYDMALDSQGNIFLAGTKSAKAYLNKYDNNGTLLFSRIFGSAGNTTTGRGVAVDSRDNAYIVGDVYSSQKTAYHGGFVNKFSSNGTLLFSTGFGYTESDKAFGVAVDAQDNPYVTGFVGSYLDGTPIDHYYIHIAVIQFSPVTGDIMWSSIIKSKTGNDAGQGIHVDSGNNLYVTGYVGGSINNVSIMYNYNGDIRDNFILKYSLPTPAPSLTPSRRPTFTPSSSPTSMPTSQPSAEPSSAPSAQPTVACVSLEMVRRAEALLSQANRLVEEAKALLNALSVPTTLSPTCKPTVSPSQLPSWMPSSKPSSRPTSSPTSVPSAQPTTPCVSLETVRKAKGMMREADKLFDEAFSLLAAASHNDSY